jgi:uncharacterized Zn-binding protein involved in type VI secretion
MPFNGTLTTGLSTDVSIEGKPAATVDSIAINQPPHIPAAGPFQKPPTNQGKILVGSTGVFINGKPAARQGDQAITCNDPADAPIGSVMAVGKVFIGETGAGAPKPPAQPPTQPKLLKAKLGQPGSIVSANWEKTNAKSTDQVKLVVNTKDFEDGTPISFLIWQKKGSQENVVAQIDSQIKSNKTEISWNPSLLEGEEEPEYYFVANIEGEEKKSQALKLT